MNKINQAIDMLLSETEYMDPKDPRAVHMRKFTKKYGHAPPQWSRVHLGSPESVFSPRGTMQKNSLSLANYEKLKDAFEQWTSPEYSDSLSDAEMTGFLEKEYEEETEAAWEAFMKNVHKPEF